MAISVATEFFNPEILTEAVQGAFGQKTAFMNSRLAALGVAMVDGSMPEGGPDAIGQTVKVPYFGSIGEFTNNPDGTQVTPGNRLQQTFEQSSITRDSLFFEISRWAQGNAKVNPKVGDPYAEAARQSVEAAARAMDKRIITAAGAAGVYLKDVYSSTTPVGINWDMVVDAKTEGWGDEQDDIRAMLVHSHTHKDMLKLKDSAGRPLLLSSQGEGGPLDTFAGLPVVISDRVPVTGSTMTANVASGTTPPVLTITGTPLGTFKLQIDCVVGGAHGTATYRFSTDGGNTWSANVTTNGTPGTAVALTDTAIDSTVGVNGATGLSAAFAAGTFNADNLWTSTTSLKVMSLLLKKGALAFWYNKNALALETDKDIKAHTNQGAMHLYGVAHRYRRLPGGTKPGIVQLVHNVSGY